MNGNDIIFENLFHLDREQMMLFERNFAHVYELALYMSSTYVESEPFFQSDVFRHTYKSLCRREINGGDLLDENRRWIDKLQKHLSVLERVYLCDALNDIFDLKIFDDIMSPKSAEDSTEASVAYFHNFYTDEAYNKFSELLKNPRVVYESSFADVCEAVFDGIAEYCIIPIENSVDGKLVGFRNLIMKYELKILSLCEIPTGDESSTTYALLGKNFVKTGVPEENGMFEFILSLNDDLSLSDIIRAAEYTGMKLRKIDSIPVSYSDGGYAYDIVFSVGDADLECFLCFLMLEAPQFIPVGTYSYVK